MFLTSHPIADLRTVSGLPAAKPCNPAALAQLHTQYAAYRRAGMGRRTAAWTEEAVITLGRLFVAAYGVIPPASYLQSAYSMPEESTIRRLFGTRQEYHAALLQEATYDA